MSKTIAPGTSVVAAEFNADGTNVNKTQVLWSSSAGTITPGAMDVALTAGYATSSSDNGHVTNPDAPNGTNEQGWALGHPQKMVDFAWCAVHVSSIAAKRIVEKFYGRRKASQSRFVGCSSGGRQALMEARFPSDFDGIVAGAPAWHWTNQMVNATWNSESALKDPSAITPDSVTIDTWVTKSQTPVVLIGSHLDANKKVDRTRLLCPYLQDARYMGKGDTNDATSFMCINPGKLPSGSM
jgi:hypothetical protein